MAETPEEKARKTIDVLLKSAGWIIQDRERTNVSAARGVAIREFPLKCRKPLPFIYQSTGIETRFTNLLEPEVKIGR